MNNSQKQELVPEIHDIGKLIDVKRSGFRHFFEHYPGRNFNDLPLLKENATLRGIKEHHLSKQYGQFPKSIETLLLCLADGFASVYSRQEERKGKENFKVHKLWKDPSDSEIKTLYEAIGIDEHKEKDWIIRIVNFINADPSAEDFFKEYEKYLKNRAEDSKVNVTSLYTHSKLTGKFYKILFSYIKNTSNDKNIPNNTFVDCTKEKVGDALENLKKEWKFNVVRFRIHFFQRPLRAKDMNIFKIFKDLSTNLKEKFEDYIFFAFSDDEFVLIASSDKDILKEIENEIKTYKYECFWIEVVGNKEFNFDEFQKLKNNCEDAKLFQSKIKYGLLQKPITIFPNLHDEIFPKICEICQMAHAPNVCDKDEITEMLCDTCYDIRKIGSTLSKLGGTWEEENATVVFLKVNMILDDLINNLNRLYLDYFKSKKEVTLPIVSEFQEDYKEFISEFMKEINDNFDAEMILDDFVVVRVNKLSEINRILQLYHNLFKTYFPKFEEIGSPIKIGISSSNVKFPFFEHWEFIKNPKDEISINVVGKGEMNLTFKKLGKLLSSDFNLLKRTALIRLAEIAEKSEKLAEISIFGRDYPEIQKAYIRDKIPLKDLCTYVKIMSD